jgi:hypothetical protein
MTLAEVGEVLGRWEEVVVPALAADVRLVRLRQGTLLVELSGPAWPRRCALADTLATASRPAKGVLVEHVEVRVGRLRRRSWPRTAHDIACSSEG